MNGPHLQALEEALAILGNSKPRLAAALATTLEELEIYLAGEAEVPYQVFLSALNVISRAAGS
jgi:hypothetical protein